MKRNFFSFMIARFALFIRHHILAAIIIFLFIIGEPFIRLAYNSYAFDNANIAREIQLLLSLSGVYPGPIDGRCDAQTKQAIAQYQKSLDNAQPNGLQIDCNVELLDSIRNSIRTNISTALTNTNGAVNHKDIDEIKSNINNINAALKGITDGFASNFLSQYNSLASSGLSAFVAAISGTIAIIALASALLKDFIKEHINSNTERVIADAKDDLMGTATRAHASLATQIYARLGGRIMYRQLVPFYKDPNCPHQFRRDRYESYLEAGVHISTIGNDSANDLAKLYKDKEIPIPDDDNKWIGACRNNFIFYASSANDACFTIRRKGDDLKKLGDVAAAITDLERMLLDGRKTEFSIHQKETLIWAKLCLGLITNVDAKNHIETLAQDADSTAEWWDDIQSRYRFYNRFPEHANNKVNLIVPPPNAEAAKQSLPLDSGEGLDFPMTDGSANGTTDGSANGTTDGSANGTTDGSANGSANGTTVADQRSDFKLGR